LQLAKAISIRNGKVTLTAAALKLAISFSRLDDRCRQLPGKTLEHFMACSSLFTQLAWKLDSTHNYACGSLLPMMHVKQSELMQHGRWKKG
jgi:hypothetical protein